MKRKLWANSLTTRSNLFLLAVIISAQLLSGLIWYQHASSRDQQGLVTTITSLARSASSTIAFFQTLPHEYRHLVLNQLRNMGGTRFFVSLNDHWINLKPLPDSDKKQLVINKVSDLLEKELAGNPVIRVDFTSREDLKVFNNELPIDQLPVMWAHYSLSYGDLNPPILVMQVEVAPHEWFYLAAVLPAPYVTLETHYFAMREWLTLLLSAVLLLSCTWFIVQREIRPIRQLAKAATLMSNRLKLPQVKEQGSAEMRAAVRAFNKMSRRIDAHIHEREMLFSAISHDLKTPIACLKLRADMLDNDVDRARFARIANDLDLMVKGALQCIKETDIHEEIEPINFNQLLEHIQQTLPYDHDFMTLDGSINATFSGKPLALKRCIQNLVDNAIKYGHHAHVSLTQTAQQITIDITDQGSQLDPSKLDKLVAPYYRLDTQIEGNGLGLTISKSIAKAHGGQLQLTLTKRQGLRATLIFPREEE